MQNFFIKALSLIVGVSVIFNILGSLADRTAPLDDWRIVQQERSENLQARREQIEAITLGNSHSDAVDYSVMGIEGQSLAFAAADLFEVEKYAELMADKLPNLKTVFIAISYYSFSRDNATFEPFRTRRIRYYSIIPIWSPIQNDHSNFVLGKLEAYTHVMSVVRSDSWKGVWVELANETPSSDFYSYDGIITSSAWGMCPHYTEEQLANHAQDIATKNVISSNQMAVAHQGLEQDAFDALVRTIEWLQSQGIQVVLFTPTYYERYNVYFMEQGTRLYEDMQLGIEELNQRYQIEYYDFSTDPEITIHPQLFYNSDHLGKCGRKVFTEKLLEAMNNHAE